jgi:hypothetical protein
MMDLNFRGEGLAESFLSDEHMFKNVSVAIGAWVVRLFDKDVTFGSGKLATLPSITIFPLRFDPMSCYKPVGLAFSVTSGLIGSLRYGRNLPASTFTKARNTHSLLFHYRVPSEAEGTFKMNPGLFELERLAFLARRLPSKSAAKLAASFSLCESSASGWVGGVVSMWRYSCEADAARPDVESLASRAGVEDNCEGRLDSCGFAKSFLRGMPKASAIAC